MFAWTYQWTMCPPTPSPTPPPGVYSAVSVLAVNGSGVAFVEELSDGTNGTTPTDALFAMTQFDSTPGFGPTYRTSYGSRQCPACEFTAATKSNLCGLYHYKYEDPGSLWFLCETDPAGQGVSLLAPRISGDSNQAWNLWIDSNGLVGVANATYSEMTPLGYTTWGDTLLIGLEWTDTDTRVFVNGTTYPSVFTPGLITSADTLLANWGEGSWGLYWAGRATNSDFVGTAAIMDAWQPGLTPLVDVSVPSAPLNPLAVL